MTFTAAGPLLQPGDQQPGLAPGQERELQLQQLPEQELPELQQLLRYRGAAVQLLLRQRQQE